MSSEWDFFEAIGCKSFDDPKMKEVVAYCVALGAFTHAWAFWEYMLDLCVAIIYSSPEGRAIDKKRPIISLERKIKYLRKAHVSIEKLKPLQVLAESIANCFEKMGTFRHTVIHSAQGYGDSPLVREFRRMIPDDEQTVLALGLVREKRVTLNYGQILEGARIISTMLAPMEVYIKSLLQIFPKREPLAAVRILRTVRRSIPTFPIRPRHARLIRA